MEKRFSGYILAILLCVGLVVVSLLIFGGSGSASSKNPDKTAVAEVSSPVTGESAPSAAPVSASPSASAVPTARQNGGVPDLSACDRADDTAFSDSVFVGNSLVDGLYLYGGVSGCSWLSGTGVSLFNLDKQQVSDKQGGSCTVLEGLGRRQYGRVYIELGINEIGYSSDVFTKSYGEFIDKVRALQPTADIYVMSLTPVSAKKSSDGGCFTKSNIQTFNKAIHQLCADKNCWYLDDFTPLAGSDGYLPADAATDGIHFVPSYYEKWMDVIRTHYV